MDAFCWKRESLERDTFDVARVDSSTNSQRHREKLFCDDYYINILEYRQEYLIRHDYQSLYPNAYHMNWNSINLYYMICVFTICMFNICINTILNNAIYICTICICPICIYTVCIYIHLIRWIHIIIIIMLSLFGIVKVANSHVHLWTCTDAPWVAQRRSVHSSPALLAAPLFDGSSHC